MEEATLYRQAIASGDMTLSTHASIFTGMYAKEHGAHNDFPESHQGRPLDEKFLTRAEILSKRSYSTMGVAANIAYLSSVFGLHQGFQYYDDRELVHFLSGGPEYYLRQTIRNLLTCFTSPYYFDQRSRRAEAVNREVFTLLDKAAEKGRPFFLFVNYMDAHWPYLPPPPFDALTLEKMKHLPRITIRYSKKRL